MRSESGAVLYKPGTEGEAKRDKEWGRHCEWPPSWVTLPEDIENLTRGMLSEREEIYQRAFQKKVAQALRELYKEDTDDLSVEQLMELSRSYWFWIHGDGSVALPRRLWLGADDA